MNLKCLNEIGDRKENEGRGKGYITLHSTLSIYFQSDRSIAQLCTLCALEGKVRIGNLAENNLHLLASTGITNFDNQGVK